MTETSMYREALQECGFGHADVERGLQMLESGRYFGFGDVVSSLGAFGRSGPAARRHTVDAVVRRVQQQESLGELGRRASKGRARAEYFGAVRAAQDEDRRRLEREEAEARCDFIENATEAELAASATAYQVAEAGGESPVRPEIARAYRRWRELSESLNGSASETSRSPSLRPAPIGLSEEDRRTAVLHEEEERLRGFLVENATDREWDDARARRPHIAANFRRWHEVNEALSGGSSTSSSPSAESGPVDLDEMMRESGLLPRIVTGE